VHTIAHRDLVFRLGVVRLDEVREVFRAVLLRLLLAREWLLLAAAALGYEWQTGKKKYEDEGTAKNAGDHDGSNPREPRIIANSPKNQILAVVDSKTFRNPDLQKAHAKSGPLKDLKT
jgi:hypothetical protein